MAAVTLNAAVRANLRTLQSASDQMTATQRRISTGKKVNGALDNPSSYFTARALDSRSSDFNNLLDNVSNSVKTLEAADNGIKSITDIVNSLKATARSALQSPSAVTTKANVESSAINGLTESNLLGTASGAVAATTTGTASGLSTGTTMGSLGVGASYFDITTEANHYQFSVNSSTTVGDVISFVNSNVPNVNASLTSGGQFKLDTANTTTSFTLGSYAGTYALGLTPGAYGPTGGTPPLSGKTLSFQNSAGATKTVTFSTTAGANNVSTLDQLNAWLDANDVDQQASVDGSGSSAKLKFETTNASANATPADLAGTATNAGGPFASDKTFSAPVLDPVAAAKRAAFVKDYNEALKQISSLAKDASYNGVNLLQGDDLEVAFNEDGSSKLDVKGTKFDFGSLGLASLADADFYDADSINKSLDTIEGVFGKLETQSSKFGSQLQIVQTRQSFTKSMIGTLDDGSAALTNADTNEEAATLATLQTRQSLITSSLSISTSAEQGILQLLR